MRGESDDPTLLVVEEKASIVKQRVVTGKVRVSTRTELVDELAQATLEHQAVDVERVAIGRQIDVAPEVRTEGDLTIIPVVEEILVVEKRLFLKEELHIRRRVTAENAEIPITLRKQTAIVEHLDSDGVERLEEETRT